jgi:hypothetical protein
MTLCFGEGSDGEGEGAISELIVFQGRLPMEDIEQLEKYLMAKHGISPVKSDAMEDEWRREVRALILQPPPYSLRNDQRRIPLGVAAKDPSVAWRRANPVTGKKLFVGRIGTKWGTDGSSDW